MENSLSRTALADLILERLTKEQAQLSQQFTNNKHKIAYCCIDNLLPTDIAKQCYQAFPSPENMKLNKSLREYKYIAAQMNRYHPLLEEAIYAFQDERIVKLIGEITSLNSLQPDKHLYAGGISLMKQHNFLNPHLDNSHDKDRKLWRALNLLYYVSPDWKLQNGGNLELWPQGTKKDPITIESKFNRLAIMITHHKSWHSVSPITADAARCCVSNYYFSDQPSLADQPFHVTSFHGRPEQPLRDLALRLDIKLRSLIRYFFKKGIKETKHLYKDNA